MKLLNKYSFTDLVLISLGAYLLFALISTLNASLEANPSAASFTDTSFFSEGSEYNDTSRFSITISQTENNSARD